MKIEVNRPCFICGATQSELLFSTNYPVFDYPGEFKIYRCTHCKLLFNSPRLSDKDIAELYNQNYYFFHRRDVGELRRMLPMYQQTIGGLEPEMAVGRVLEIGSAKGYFLAVLKKLGWTVFGIEISVAASQFAREKFGIPGFAGTLEDYVAQKKFDTWPLVLALDVLEHVTQPDDFVAQLNRVTKTGGTVIFMTPNGGAANIEILQADWSGFNPFHIFIFSPENITRLLEKHGFAVQKIFSYNNARQKRGSIPQSDQKIFNGLTKSFFKKIRLNNLMKNLRFKIWNLLDQSQRKIILEEVVSEIQQQGNYFSTPDSQGELAKSCAGDNLVIIAKKV
jgi:2-polyprenyl-3-methyl-5-hydroxy-6-metoxy-1,4-benzoquinol methylase